MPYQSTILRAVEPVGAALVFDLEPGTDPRRGLDALRRLPEQRAVVGLGEPLSRALGAQVPGLRTFPALSGVGLSFPSTQGALWLMLGGTEHGEVLDLAMKAQRWLGAGWRLTEEVSTFRYRGGRDLTGYEDGTENPTGAKAEAAAIIASGPPGVVGGSFAGAQRYVHDLQRFAAHDAAGRDALIGRHLEGNEEIPDAVASAHVKRSAQESFDPPAFMVRRSMPWGGVAEHGLYFVAYVEALDRFERVLRRMAGLDDGIVDGLMRFTRAVSGGYYFCPPVEGGALDLRAIGL